MRRGNRAALVFGILLILGGVLSLVIRINPQLQTWFMEYWAWPMIFMVIGLLLFLLGLIIWEPGMAIPAVILVGIGLIFYYQVQSSDWMSWTYMWALIPGFVGIGILIASLMEGNWRSMRSGFDLIFISAVIYVIMASILGGLTLLGPYGPAILMILLGIYILIRGAMSARRKQVKDLR